MMFEDKIKLQIFFLAHLSSINIKHFTFFCLTLSLHFYKKSHFSGLESSFFQVVSFAEHVTVFLVVNLLRVFWLNVVASFPMNACRQRSSGSMQATTDVVNPALTLLPLQQMHIYFPVGFLDVVLRSNQLAPQF